MHAAYKRICPLLRDHPEYVHGVEVAITHGGHKSNFEKRKEELVLDTDTAKFKQLPTPPPWVDAIYEAIDERWDMSTRDKVARSERNLCKTCVATPISSNMTE